MVVRPLLSLGLFAVVVVSHTTVRKPTPREDRSHNSEFAECGSDRTLKGTYQRGQVIDYSWARNNHHGGFVQGSVLPLSQVQGTGDGQRDQFDDPANIIHVSCYNQANCPVNGGGDKMGVGGDPPPIGDNTNMCNTKLTIPTYLPDGDYVLKTLIFGNGDSNNIRNKAHTSYSNCHNFRVTGGATAVAKPTTSKNAHIEWKLSDYTIDKINLSFGTNIASNDQCFFMASNTHMGCTNGNGSPNLRCRGPVADASRCGSPQADTRADCNAAESWRSAAGNEELYTWMVGRPPYHPNYDGKFKLIHHDGKIVDIDLGGGSTGTGTTTPIGDWLTCTAGQTCNPGFTCCVAQADVAEKKMTCRSSGCVATTAPPTPALQVQDWATCVAGQSCNPGFTCCVATADFATGKMTCRSSGCRASVETNPCDTLCLSQWGYCGSTIDYCGVGCKAGPCLRAMADNVLATIQGIVPLQCVLDQPTRTFEVRLGHSTALTVEQCALQARVLNYSYIGVEFGVECYASKTKPVMTPASNCDVPCAGDGATMCGGKWALSVFNISGVPLGGLTMSDMVAEIINDNKVMAYVSSASRVSVSLSLTAAVLALMNVYGV